MGYMDNKAITIFTAIILAGIFIFLGYQWAMKAERAERDEWRVRTKEEIREELKLKAKKNYEDYIRRHGIDSMDVYERVDWLMSNSAYD
jgi:Tfp pilus assembly protein PilO